MRILIIAVILVGLVAVTGSIIMGQKVFDGKVVDKPYETGLLWDKMQREKAELRVEIKDRNFRTGDNEINFFVLDKEGNPLFDAAVMITLSRPSTTIYDRDYEALKSKDHGYRAVVHLPLYGYWDIKIRVIRRGNDLAFEKRIYSEK